MMLAMAEKDIRSNKAFDQLSTIATSATGATQARAFDCIAEHHANNNELIGMFRGLGRGLPSQETEDWLKAICTKSKSDTIKANAAVALSDFVNKRNSYRDFYADADENVRKSVNQEMLAYLEKKPEPGENEMIETIMDDYVSGNEKLMEKVKKQLFLVHNLGIGKTAPDIAAVDLDGVEFKLSDYRGKVVFLDFWGDW